ncbi:MAG: hypothetical protein J5662_03455, partial [Clostridia bacterium]|nr:hypothetical protein [Clostridia bacterium]
FAKKYLLFGKLLKTTPADSKKSTAFVLKSGFEVKDSVVLNRRFEAEDGSVAEFFVNRTFTEQEFCPDSTVGKLYMTPEKFQDVTETVKLKPGGICCIVNT